MRKILLHKDWDCYSKLEPELLSVRDSVLQSIEGSDHGARQVISKILNPAYPEITFGIITALIHVLRDAGLSDLADQVKRFRKAANKARKAHKRGLPPVRSSTDLFLLKSSPFFSDHRQEIGSIHTHLTQFSELDSELLAFIESIYSGNEIYCSDIDALVQRLEAKGLESESQSIRRLQATIRSELLDFLGERFKPEPEVIAGDLAPDIEEPEVISADFPAIQDPEVSAEAESQVSFDVEPADVESDQEAPAALSLVEQHYLQNHPVVLAAQTVWRENRGDILAGDFKRFLNSRRVPLPRGIKTVVRLLNAAGFYGVTSSRELYDHLQARADS